jgi:hypothetical protein
MLLTTFKYMEGKIKKHTLLFFAYPHFFFRVRPRHHEDHEELLLTIFQFLLYNFVSNLNQEWLLKKGG